MLNHDYSLNGSVFRPLVLSVFFIPVYKIKKKLKKLLISEKLHLLTFHELATEHNQVNISLIFIIPSTTLSVV